MKNILVHDSNDKILNLNKSKFLKIIYDFDNISWEKIVYYNFGSNKASKDVKDLLKKFFLIR